MYDKEGIWSSWGQNSRSTYSIAGCNTYFLMASLTRLKKGKEKSDSQIKKIQTEIDDLKQVIEDTETQKTNLKRQLRQQRLGKGPKRSNFFKNLQHAKMKRIYLS